MEVPVQGADSGGDIVRLLVQVADILVDHLPDGGEVLPRPVGIQSLTHPAIEPGQFLVTGGRTGCLNGQCLELGQRPPLPQSFGPLPYPAASDLDRGGVQGFQAGRHLLFQARVTMEQPHHIHPPLGAPGSVDGSIQFTQLLGEVIGFQLAHHLRDVFREGQQGRQQQLVQIHHVNTS